MSREKQIEEMANIVKRIELVFEFCPNCGRKMKGGAE
jgi:hypothetical protein